MMPVVFLFLTAYCATAAILLKLGVVKPGKVGGHSPLAMVLLAGAGGLWAVEAAGLVGTIFHIGLLLFLVAILIEVHARKSE